MEREDSLDYPSEEQDSQDCPACGNNVGIEMGFIGDAPLVLCRKCDTYDLKGTP